MNHAEIEELLGAYALDATTAEERAQVEAHLAECPSCRAEVTAHLEVAALLGTAGTGAPTGLWEKIAASLASQPGGAQAEAPEPPALPPPVTGAVSIHRAPAGAPAPPAQAVPAPAQAVAAPAPPAQAPPAQAVPAPAPAPLRPRAGRRLASVVSAVAIAAAALVVLGIELGRLHSQVQTLKSQVAAQDLKGSEVAANAAPHVTVDLALANRQPAATVVVTPSGGAYWEWSSLRNLPASQTYQLWGLVRGKPVSLALVGAKPDTISFFRLQPQATVLMVTAEPEGGVPSPTTPVLAQGAVPPSALS